MGEQQVTVAVGVEASVIGLGKRHMLTGLRLVRPGADGRGAVPVISSGSPVTQ